MRSRGAALGAFLTAAISIHPGCARYDVQGNYLFLLLLSVLATGQGRIFLTAAQTTGNIGGISGADAICNSDVNRPSTFTTYKALLVDGSSRSACSSTNCATNGIAENIDWVLRPNKSYFRTDGTLILTTNAAGITPFNLTASFTGAGDLYWTGMRSTPNDWQSSTANRCLFWADGTAFNNGGTGIGNAVDSTSIRNTNPTCSSQRQLLCVEQ